ncbi:2-hydroxy-6-oxononadienedioate/2-hydroxy-6-oxononatrienedioate hydrolase [Chlorella vulgaris]
MASSDPGHTRNTEKGDAASAGGALEGAMDGMMRVGLGVADALHRGVAAITSGSGGAVKHGGEEGQEGRDEDDSVDLQHYAQLQQSIADLQGLQYEKLGMGKWYPGKLLLQNQDKKLEASGSAVEMAEELVRQRQQQVAALSGQLQAVQLQLEIWEGKAGELVVAQAEVAVVEERIFGTHTGLESHSSQRRLHLVDCLCAMEAVQEQIEATESSQGEATDEDLQPETSQPHKVGGFGCWGGGRLLGLATPSAATLGPTQGGRLKRMFTGRLLRVHVRELDRAAAGGELQVELAGTADVEVEAEGSSFKLGELQAQPEESEEGGAGVKGSAGAAGSNMAAPAAGEGSEAQGPQHRLGEGQLLGTLADKLGKPVPGQHKDGFGGYGRGRLLRIAADKLGRAAAARRKEREAAMRKDPIDDESLAELFPPAACKFNPALHCPPSTFLWTYSNRFMGRLKKLRTGDVLHAFYRFGPFGSSLDTAASAPPSPGRSAASSGNGGLPLLMLSGLGSTMVSWGVPLMRALSVSNEAEAVLMLADALNIPRFNWVGWSSGGDVGLVLAALHGHRVFKMISHAGVAGGTNTIAPPALRFLDPDAKVSLGQTMALIFPPQDPLDFRRTCAQYIKEVFSMPKSIVDAEVSKKCAQEQFKADQAFLEGEEQVWSALPGITAPCLITNGSLDVLVPPENARRLAERIPGARLHLFEGWGHGFKDSAAFARVLDEFLCSEGSGSHSGGDRPHRQLRADAADSDSGTGSW